MDLNAIATGPINKMFMKVMCILLFTLLKDFECNDQNVFVLP